MSTLRTLRRATGWLAVALALAACQAPFVSHQARAATPQSVTQQPGDIPGMQKCGVSGDVNAVLQAEKQSGYLGYDVNATEWAQWQRQGATSAYFAVYGSSRADCAAASAGSTGAPRGGLMVDLVVQFQNAAVAQQNYQRDSTLMGLGPKDIRFIELAGGSTTFGTATGLGTESETGSAVVAGANYFVARWQNKSFESDFIGYDVPSQDAQTAVLDMNRRIA